MEKKGLQNIEDVRAELENVLLEIGALKAELEAVKADLKEQRAVTWRSLCDAEKHCKERAKLWSIRAHKAHIKSGLRSLNAEAKRLNKAVIDIGYDQFAPTDDDSTDVDDGEFDDIGNIVFSDYSAADEDSPI